VACPLPYKHDISGRLGQFYEKGGEAMKSQKAFVVTCFLVTIFLVQTPTVQADPVTIEGIVNEMAQIVTDDGDVYDLAQTDLGKAVAELVGARVLLTGSVEETETNRTIAVDKFLVLDEEGRITMR
jgi:hypothetical protein